MNIQNYLSKSGDHILFFYFSYEITKKVDFSLIQLIVLKFDFDFPFTPQISASDISFKKKYHSENESPPDSLQYFGAHKASSKRFIFAQIRQKRKKYVMYLKS